MALTLTGGLMGTPGSSHYHYCSLHNTPTPFLWPRRAECTPVNSLHLMPPIEALPDLQGIEH